MSEVPRPSTRSTPGSGDFGDALDDPDDVGDLADVPSVEVISRAALLLMSAAAERLGLADADPDGSPHRDLDEARRLITALTGLVNAAVDDLGPHAASVLDGLSALQLALRDATEAAEVPDVADPPDE